MERPAFKGGQGRSSQDVRDDAGALFLGLAVLACLLVWVGIYEVMT